MYRKIVGKRKFQVGVVIVTLVGIIFFDIGGIFSPFRTAFWTITAPVANPLRSFVTTITMPFEVFFSLSDIKRLNENLFEENKQMEAKLAQLASIEKENETLREELDFAQKADKKFVVAKIIGYGDPGAGEWITINKGREEAIKENNPVFAHASVLIGSVEEVYAHTSRIRLITSGESIINVRVADTHAKGIIRGRYGLGLQLDMILSTQSLHEGDRIVTSAIGQQFPPDLYVGTLRDIRMSDDGLSQQAVIDQGVSLYDIEFVHVDVGV